ncbi:MAG: hypothetical protein NVSMB6_28800 [Burkholderiaceae bacterium]
MWVLGITEGQGIITAGHFSAFGNRNLELAEKGPVSDWGEAPKFCDKDAANAGVARIGKNSTLGLLRLPERLKPFVLPTREPEAIFDVTGVE